MHLSVQIGLLVALLTALINVNGAVAALLPVVVVMAVRLKRNPSQLLMPLVFSAYAGSVLALTRTPVNVLVAEAAADAGFAGFNFFEFTIIGIPMLAKPIAIIVLFGQRLLPKRGGRSVPSDFGRPARTLVEQYGLSAGIGRLRLRATSPLVGQSLEALDLSGHARLKFVFIQNGSNGDRLRRPVLAEGDYILVSGEAEAAAGLAAEQLLGFRQEHSSAELEETLFKRSSTTAPRGVAPSSGIKTKLRFQSVAKRGVCSGLPAKWRLAAT